MDWSNENWVRMYTRDTEDDLVLPWQARAIWKEMLCKFDRSGLIELKRGRAGLAALVRYPIEVIDVAIPELVADGRVREIANGYFAPNFMTAQEAPASDKHRKRESREKRRARSAAATPNGQSVTNRDHDGSLDADPVTKRDRLSGYPPHRSLLPNLTSDQERSPDLDRPELPDPGATVRAEHDQVRTRDHRTKLAMDSWRYAALKQSELKGEGIDPTAIGWGINPGGEAWAECKARVDEVLQELGDPPDLAAAEVVLRRRIDVATVEARRAGHLRWFIPMRIWHADSFAIGASMSPEQAAQAGQPRAGARGTNGTRTPEPERRRLKQGVTS